jgi:hypothetical protein
LALPSAFVAEGAVVATRPIAATSTQLRQMKTMEPRT